MVLAIIALFAFNRNRRPLFPYSSSLTFVGYITTIKLTIIITCHFQGNPGPDPVFSDHEWHTWHLLFNHCVGLFVKIQINDSQFRPYSSDMGRLANNKIRSSYRHQICSSGAFLILLLSGSVAVFVFVSWYSITPPWQQTPSPVHYERLSLLVIVLNNNDERVGELLVAWRE